MPPPGRHDRDTLVAELRARGIDYLAPGDAVSRAGLDDEALLAALAAEEDPRLRQALVALFLLHPGLAHSVPSLRAQLPPGAREELLVHYLAAVYLQEMWWHRLLRYLPDAGRLPDDLCRELALPRREELHGKVGLHALAEWHESRSPHRTNRLSEYEGAAALLLASLKQRSRRHEPAAERR
jgi:hypothetical protein